MNHTHKPSRPAYHDRQDVRAWLSKPFAVSLARLAVASAVLMALGE